MIIAVDFDGTIVEDRYPAVGPFPPRRGGGAARLRREGYVLVLWTCRTGRSLAEAVKACAEAGIRFEAVNSNLRCRVVAHGGSDPRKVGADLYIDDRGLAPLPPWEEVYALVHERLPTREDEIDRAIGW